jgi:hypothetical protein
MPMWVQTPLSSSSRAGRDVWDEGRRTPPSFVAGGPASTL